MRHVHETAGQVAGIGGLERCVCQALARAVRRDEVLEHRESFAEVGSDWRFHDLARRLGHQPAHAGKLANLLLRSASAGVRHDIDGVDAALFVLAFKRLEHFVGDFFSDVAPDGNDLVVAFAMRDGAVQILLLDAHDFLFAAFDQLALVAGNEHVVNADRNAGLGGVGEAQLFQVIEQDDGVFEAKAQIGVINELLDTLLLEQAIHVGEFFRQVRIKDDAPYGRLNELALHLHWHGMRHVLVVVRSGQVDDFAGVAQANGREQFNFAGFQRKDDFFGSTEHAAFPLGTRLVLGQIVDA